MSGKIRNTGNFMLRVYDHFCNGCAHVSAWMMLGMTLIIAYEVVVRYFFNRPTTWVNDFTDYIMLYSIFLVSAWLLKHGIHIRLTILSGYLSPRSQGVVEIINSFICAISCGVLVWYGVADTWDAVEKGIILARNNPIPKYLILMVIPLGFLLLFIQFLRNGFKLLNDLKGSPKVKVQS